MARVNNLLKGTSPDIIQSNVQTLKDAGYEHGRAVRCALCHSKKSAAPKLNRISASVVKKDPIRVKVAPTAMGLKSFNG